MKDYPNFYQNYQDYPLHYAVVRVKAKHLLDRSTPRRDGQAARLDDRYVYLSLYAADPLEPIAPGPYDSFNPKSYDVSFEASAGSTAANLGSSLDYVPTVFERVENGKLVPAKVKAKAVDFPLKQQLPELAARVKLAAGETWTAMGRIEDRQGVPIKYGYLSRSGCQAISGASQLVANCVAEGKPMQPFVDQLLQHVMAEKTVSGPVTMSFTSHEASPVTHTFSLVPDENGLVVEILNTPVQEILNLPDPMIAQSGLEHFNLYQLLADRASSSKSFFYPYPVEQTPNVGRPFCVPGILSPPTGK